MGLYLLSLAALFSVLNPLGTVPVFVSLTKGKTKKEINKISLATAINVLIILLISFFLGKFILVFFGISLNSLKIAGGLIIASSGFALLTGKFSQHKGMSEKVKSAAMEQDDISLTPLAIPMLAGPGTISLLITYHQEYTQLVERGILVGTIITISILIYFILRSSLFIVKALGPSGINALSRVIGFIVIAIGIEYILSTIILLFK
ncbi:MAG TPA: MarC family protein [Flavobacteriaceae bacterium]|nr:NAAT family transporter [Flavobacteriaceae bacterium]HEX5742961.1 MarC family protein [Flavobacteriaceae bacterium]